MTMPSWELASAPPYSLRQRVRRPRELRHLHAIIRIVLRTPVLHALIDGWVCELRYADPATGRRTSVPVRYAHAGNEVVTLVTPADTGRWWLAFHCPQPVDVLLHRGWHRGRGRLLAFGRTGWQQARQVHTDRFPHDPVDDADLFITVALEDPTFPAG